MKIGQLYNLQSFKDLRNSSKKPGFIDAAPGVVLDRNLTQVDPKIFEKLYPELSFVNSGVTIDNTGGYAQRIQSLRLREQGQFTNADDPITDKGKISLAAEDSFLKVLIREAHSVWTDDEIKQADLQGVNLVSRFIETHNKIYQREVDEIGYIGIPNISASEGLLNYSGFTSSSAGGAISTLTATEMYDAIAGLIIDQWNAVNNTPGYIADTVSMPVSVMNELNKTILSVTNGSQSVMSALRDNFPGISFVATFRAESVDGDSATVAFSTNEEVMKMRIPLPLTVGEIIKMNSFDFRVDSKYRVAGIDILEDAGGRLLTGL